MEHFFKWIRKVYNKSIHSLGFFPAMITLCFLGLSIILLELDASGIGEKVNKQVSWLTLKDASTATTIAATIAAGIISIMVFSFSMVMVVMNQAASQMSNRMLDNLIGGKLQKLVLSFYIGTIVYAFVLLSNIGDTGEAPVPILSIYFLILLAIVDIFLFVTFLHFITQSIRYEQLIQTVHNKAQLSLFHFSEEKRPVDNPIVIEGEEILARESGYYQGFNKKRLLKICHGAGIAIRFLHVRGEYVLKDTPLLLLQSEKEITEPVLRKIFEQIDFFYGQEIDKNPYYAFIHLMEAGIKALSPGINDPGTAVFSLNAITNLLAYKMHHEIPMVLFDTAGTPRIMSEELSFEELFNRSILPIWDYGRKDRIVQGALLRTVRQLRQVDKENRYDTFFKSLEADINAAQGELSFQLQKHTNEQDQ